MFAVWHEITLPLCETLKPRTIVEIGAEFGLQTRLLLEYAKKHGGIVHVIDPVPQFDVAAWQAEFGQLFVFYQSLSLDVLPRLEGADLLLIDGDHNWFTIYNELKAIEAKVIEEGRDFPVILLHDVGWPYARRDLYYNPDNVPAEFRQPYARKGMNLGQSALVEKGGYNYELANATHEGGPRNGVLTGIEDFLRETQFKLSFLKFPVFNGIGLIGPSERFQSDPDLRRFLEERHINGPMLALLEKLEDARLASETNQFNTDSELKRTQKEFFRVQNEFDVRSAWTVELQEEQEILEGDLHAAKREIASLKDLLTQKNAVAACLSDLIRQVEAGPVWRARSAMKSAIAPASRVMRAALERQRRLIEVSLYVLKREGISSFAGKAVRRLLFKLPAYGRRLKLKTSWGKLSFQTFDAPKVSIIIPVYNKHEYTFNCLFSLSRFSHDCEVIVVDDCSSDETPEMLAAIAGVRTIRNSQNSGFIGSCNAGARAARGEYLVFLNNDTMVTSGWLDELLNVFNAKKDAGLVGAKLVYPDGRLQEAGGIVWSDGSGWNFGRFDDPGRPEYNYLRKTDYCSGACIMIPAKLFSELGGFDASFAPAYYEDVDLAFRVRRAGYSVYYQPKSSIVHFEGISSGTDVSSGVKSYQKTNQAKFYARWKDELLTHRPPGQSPELEKDRPAAGRALVIDAAMLTPDCDAGSLRMWQILLLLRDLGFQVTFAPANCNAPEPYASLLQNEGIEVVYRPYASDIRAFIHETCRRFDVAIISRADVATEYLSHVKESCPNALVVFDTVDLHFLRESRLAKLDPSPRARVLANRRKRQEVRLCKTADLTLVVSPVEQEILRKEGVESVEILSLIQDADAEIKPFEERQDIVFIAGFNHPPNVDAVLFFTREIWPVIHQAQPDIRLIVVGANPPPAIRELAAADILVTGYVKDLRPYLQGSRLSVAPLRYGAGVKGKITSSLAAGLPVVCTKIAAEGMYLEHRQSAMITDAPLDFAQAVIEVYTDRTLWESLSRGGLNVLHHHFSSARAKAVLECLMIEQRPLKKNR